MRGQLPVEFHVIDIYTMKTDLLYIHTYRYMMRYRMTALPTWQKVTTRTLSLRNSLTTPRATPWQRAKISTSPVLSTFSTGSTTRWSPTKPPSIWPNFSSPKTYRWCSARPGITASRRPPTSSCYSRRWTCWCLGVVTSESWPSRAGRLCLGTQTLSTRSRPRLTTTKPSTTERDRPPITDRIYLYIDMLSGCVK